MRATHGRMPFSAVPLVVHYDPVAFVGAGVPLPARAWTFAMARWSQQSTFDQTSVDFYLDYRPLHYLRENR